MNFWKTVFIASGYVHTLDPYALCLSFFRTCTAVALLVERLLKGAGLALFRM